MRAIVLVMLAACGGSVESSTVDATPPSGSETEGAPQAEPGAPPDVSAGRRRLSVPPERCVDDGRLMPWTPYVDGFSNGYNARVIFCTHRAAAGLIQLCAVPKCVAGLPSKSCTDAEFGACDNALDKSGPVEPQSCYACF